jgi:hypothetical protein
LAAERIAAMAVNARAHAKFVGELLGLLDGLGEGVDLEMDGNVFGPGNGGAFEDVPLIRVSGQIFNAKRDDGNTGVLVGFDDLFKGAGLVKIGVDAAELHFIQADFADFLRNVRIFFEFPKTVTLNSKIQCFAHDDFLFDDG